MKNPEAYAFILIPAYNEERRIASVVKELRERYPSMDVLVVNDGSDDETREKAREAGARVISHPFNLGYGAALQTGYKYALNEGYEALIQIDGDGQHDPAFVDGLLSLIQRGEADVAIGSRFLETGGTEAAGSSYRPPLLRRWGMDLFGAIASVIIKQKVTDPTSGYQAMNRRVLEWVAGEKFPWDYPDADVIIMLHRAGFRIREVPVRMYENRDKKSMHSGWKPFYYVFKMFLSILVTLIRK